MKLEDRCPIRRSDVQMHEVADEMVLFDSNRDQAFSLNPSARAIWNLCDGERTVREIAEELADVVGEPAWSIQEDVESTVREFAGLDIVRWKHANQSTDNDAN